MERTEEDVAKDVVNFLRVNDPKKTTERIKVRQEIVSGPCVYTPSILGPFFRVYPNAPLSLKVVMEGKVFATTVLGVDDGLQLAVLYENIMLGEIVEAGIAQKIVLELPDFNNIVFEGNDGIYIPAEGGTMVFPQALYPFYKKEVIPQKQWEELNN